MSQATEIAHRMKMRMAGIDKKAAVRRMADAAEGAAGSFVGGYVQGRYPTVAGVPTAAAVALVGVTAGIALDQDDVTAFALGVGQGYLAIKGHELGSQAASGGTESAPNLYSVNG